MQALEIGQAEVLRETSGGVAILAWGDFIDHCEPVAEKLDCTLVNMRFAKPLDEALLHQLAETHDCLVTVENHAVMGGGGSAVNEFLQQHRYRVPVLNIGIPDQFVDHGTQAEIYAQLGLDSDGIEASIREFCIEN